MSENKGLLGAFADAFADDEEEEQTKTFERKQTVLGRRLVPTGKRPTAKGCACDGRRTAPTKK